MMSAALRPSPLPMSVAEFLAWSDGLEDGLRWQLVDGVPVAMSPPRPVHGAIQFELTRLIGNHLLAIGSPCTVLGEAGVVPRIGAQANVRIPDFAVICSADLGGAMLPDPVLLGEVLSPGNAKITRANVWSYASIPTVSEILLLHSTRIEGELLRRDGRDWPAGPDIIRADGLLTLSSIGLSVPLAAVYRTSGLKA